MTPDIAVSAGEVYLRRESGEWTPATQEDWGHIVESLLQGRRSVTPPPSEEFREAVVKYLRNEEGRSNYGQMLHTYLDTVRFEKWVSMVDAYHSVEGSSVLVSGCQSGGSLVAWWAGGAKRVEGVDIDKALIELAQLRVDGLPSCEARMYDGQHLPYGDGEFDIVESLDVIEHVPWPELYLREISRVMRPGGVAVLSTPNRAYPVEQHVRIFGPPWLSIERANRSATWLADHLPAVSEDMRWRLRVLPEIRAVNVSFGRLRRWSIQSGLRLELPNPDAHGPEWPLPRDSPLIEKMSRNRLLKFVAPTEHLTVLLRKEE